MSDSGTSYFGLSRGARVHVVLRSAVLVVALSMLAACEDGQVALDCSKYVSPAPHDESSMPPTLPEVVAIYATPAAFSGDVDGQQRTITVTDVIAVANRPDALEVGATLEIDDPTACAAPELLEMDEATILGGLSSDNTSFTLIAVVLPDGTFIPTTWQESFEDTQRDLGLDDVQLTLRTLVENVE